MSTVGYLQLAAEARTHSMLPLLSARARFCVVSADMAMAYSAVGHPSGQRHRALHSESDLGPTGR